MHESSSPTPPLTSDTSSPPYTPPDSPCSITISTIDVDEEWDKMFDEAMERPVSPSTSIDYLFEDEDEDTEGGGTDAGKGEYGLGETKEGKQSAGRRATDWTASFAYSSARETPLPAVVPHSPLLAAPNVSLTATQPISGTRPVIPFPAYKPDRILPAVPLPPTHPTRRQHWEANRRRQGVVIVPVEMPAASLPQTILPIPTAPPTAPPASTATTDDAKMIDVNLLLSISTPSPRSSLTLTPTASHPLRHHPYQRDDRGASPASNRPNDPLPIGSRHTFPPDFGGQWASLDRFGRRRKWWEI
ncbi:uncharacterized protein MKK02DRAFT_38394 [Dioszegia hungarica]|uniref:Uncharacterized protein n=1 Tax=Dioszegia hungarica TaxID=4972 RepID=A0AA38H3D5_9TREE|nr:uncharacterized protein MKK02DRAFT_38394 [Dioszegia hungarica]KAI9633737.1 hypothetical protein MKK02DRAFT_38394 [Dioszegia hungarica]